ncbi:MAG: hypothetical protein ACJAV2_002882, partial [Myxococcota bacterium]
MAWLAEAYAHYSGTTIGETIADMRAQFNGPRTEATRLAEWFDVDAARPSTAQKRKPWKETRERLARSLATSLHAARRDDAGLAAWLSQARSTIRSAAARKAVDAAAVEQRVGGGMRAVAPAYAAVFGPVEQVFTGTSDPAQRRKVQQA